MTHGRTVHAQVSSAKSRNRIATDGASRLAQMLNGMGGPVTRFSIGAVPSGVVMTLYRVRYGPYHAHLRMVRTRDSWAISSIDRI